MVSLFGINGMQSFRVMSSDWKRLVVFLLIIFFSSSLLVLHAEDLANEKETLSPIKGNIAPQNFGELWSNFDPRKEPLETEILKEWEENGIVIRVVRFRIGVFRGKTAKLAAIYGFPIGGANLPGLVQIHGGGQYADHRAVLLNARRGYATVSISWAGRISATNYTVNPEGVKLFWENKTDHPDFKLTTDWGALDGYHAPSRNPGNDFTSVKPHPWTLDEVESPRNCPWFLCTLAARRALTFLERQPEVDVSRLGVYGHSMGGKLTVMTAGTDNRVKAAAPSCGGISDRDNKSELYRKTISDENYLKRIDCPIIFLSPSNDFHGRINDLQTAISEVPSQHVRMTCSPHANHQDNAEFEVATQLWFDQWLKEKFKFPKSPKVQLTLNTADHVPSLLVDPDSSRKILSVNVFYTQQGKMDEGQDDIMHSRNRFWHHAGLGKGNGDNITAKLPLLFVDRPLWVYANVLYELDDPVVASGYYYRTYGTKVFNLSSRMIMVSPQQLSKAGVKLTDSRSSLIESFDPGWQREWFTYRKEDWARKTHKVYDPKWKAPEDAKLSLSVRSEKPNQLVIGIDSYAAEINLKGGNEWQEIILSPADFKNVNGEPLSSFEGIKELRLGSLEFLRAIGRGKRKSKKVGGVWQGPKPEFKSLRWVGTR